MHPIVAMVGPTAVGKTDVSIALAKRLDAEIIGCDSMQVYRGLGALTAQPTAAQRAAVPHHLIDCVEPTEAFSAGRYRALALAAMAEIQRRGNHALVLGGTGLYLKALRDGLCEAPPADPALRTRLSEELASRGREALLDELSRVDPEAARRDNAANPRRLVRALEVSRMSGRPLSSFWRTEAAERVPMAVVGLTRSREDLYARIERRVTAMIDDEAVLAQARWALESRFSLTARQVHGLRFLEAYLTGTCSRAETIARWQQQVRRYAKRQLTWFRADPRIRWIEVAADERTDSVVHRILGSLP